jgi:hypothetical protein
MKKTKKGKIKIFKQIEEGKLDFFFQKNHVKNKRNLLLAWMLPSFLPNNSEFSTHFKKRKERAKY